MDGQQKICDRLNMIKLKDLCLKQYRANPFPAIHDK